MPTLSFKVNLVFSFLYELWEHDHMTFSITDASP